MATTNMARKVVYMFLSAYLLSHYFITVKKDDPILVAALRGYHEELMTNNNEIAARLASDHNIILRYLPTTRFFRAFQTNALFLCVSASSVKRARHHNHLVGGATNLRIKSRHDSEQLVLDQLDLDPSGQAGPRTIRHRIAARQGEHLPRAFVLETMKTHAPQGFEKRNPGSRKIIRTKKVPLGIHERWSCDGHDKLYKIGFPVYAFVDDASGKWLDARVVPSNRFGAVIGYLFLCCVEKYGGESHDQPCHISCSRDIIVDARYSPSAHHRLWI